MKTFIIGKNSNLSISLKKNILNTEIISLSNKKDIEKIKKYKKKFNIIFNNFYPVFLLNNLDIGSLKNFYKKSINENIELLEDLNFKYINKILYSSSSSVYGSFDNNQETADTFNRRLYSSVKLSNEKLFLNISKKKKVECKILRIFNIYGGKKDNFSFIKKVTDVKSNGGVININNSGKAVRDFIHVNDIAKIYSLLLKKNNIKEDILDIGSGVGIKIFDLVKFISLKNNQINFVKNKINEQKISIADMRWLSKIKKNFAFISIEKFIKEKIKNKKIKSKNIFRYPFKNKNTLENIKEGSVIYGFGNAGKQIFEELKNRKENVICFIDDNIKFQNKVYKNTQIFSYERFLSIHSNYKINKVILSIPSLDINKEKQIIDKLKKESFDVRSLPNKKFLNSDHIALNDLKYLNLERILKLKDFRFEKINQFENKKILVTGAGGSIGSEVCRQLSKFPVKKIFALDHSEINLYNFQNQLSYKEKIKFILEDIRNIDSLEYLIRKEKFDIIIHCAAYKHLNILEKNPIQAFTNNTLATYDLCNLSIKYMSSFLLISTDKAVKPKSVLGYSKFAAEKIVTYLASKRLKKNQYINIVRFGNVIGSSGSAIPNFIDQINYNKPITVTDKKVTRYFMSINQACYLILKTFELKLNEKVFILDMGNSIKIIDIINHLIKFKKSITPSYKPYIIQTGLRQGEKIHEELFYNKKKKISKLKKIFVESLKFKNRVDPIKFLKLGRLYKSRNDNKKMLILLKKFCLEN